MSAESLCDDAIKSFVGWKADAMVLTDAAIAADQDHVLPKLLKAWMLQGSRDESHAQLISRLVTDSERVISPNAGREQALLQSLKFASVGKGIEAATCLHGYLQENPTDIMVHLIGQNEVFWLGRADWMRDLAEQAAPAWHDGIDGYSAFLAVRSFANEESGHFDDAERYGLMSLELDPSDVWAAHSVAHVLDTRGEVQRGIQWLEGLSHHWKDANQLRHHLWWHICLLLMEVGDYDRILDLLTREVRNPESRLVQASPAAPIDIQDVASLLLRLELYGVEVADHWQTLASICANRINNHNNAFGNIHDMMVLTATGQLEKSNELLQSMYERYHSSEGSVALSYTAVGIPACEAILAHRSGDYQLVLDRLGAIRHDLALMGASVVQRDLFFHLLIDAADRLERNDLVKIFLADVSRLGLCDVPKRAAYRTCSK